MYYDVKKFLYDSLFLHCVISFSLHSIATLIFKLIERSKILRFTWLFFNRLFTFIQLIYWFILRVLIFVHAFEEDLIGRDNIYTPKNLVFNR